MWVVVKLGAANDRFVEVKEGLHSDDQVVANPLVLMTEDEKRARFGKPTEPTSRGEPGKPAPKKGIGRSAREPGAAD
jgi:hypothetical protein